MSTILRFPLRRAHAIFVSSDQEGGWLVLVHGHGWLHGDRAGALADAIWLSANLGIPIRTTQTSSLDFGHV